MQGPEDRAGRLRSLLGQVVLLGDDPRGDLLDAVAQLTSGHLRGDLVKCKPSVHQLKEPACQTIQPPRLDSVSTGEQSGPWIGVQKGPPLGACCPGSA
jgi:hypothetical protein